MRYFFAFLIKNAYYFLFIILEVIAGILIVRNYQYQSSVIFNASTELTGGINNRFNSISQYFGLRKANEALAIENALLRAKLKESMLSRDTSRFAKIDTLLKQEYTYTAAKVIHNSVSGRNNYLMLNKGSVDGLHSDMAVISPEGVVGIVSKVSAHFAWVISVLHKQTKLSCKIKKNGFVGTLVWDGMNYHNATLKDIPANVLIAKGDTIITSGYSSIFPQGIKIGTIKEFVVDKGYNFYEISVNLSQDMNKLAWVYVVTDYFKEEKSTLEKFVVDE
ncbi:MAG: rod shape-determining protein MreC [Bacteroidota bacterium]